MLNFQAQVCRVIEKYNQSTKLTRRKNTHKSDSKNVGNPDRGHINSKFITFISQNNLKLDNSNN